MVDRVVQLRRPRRRAFTLFELVLVMLILAVVMAMVAPKLGGIAKGRKTGDTATQVVALAYYARSEAITEGRTYRLNVEPRNGTYWLTRQDGGVFQDPGNGWGTVFQLPEGLRIESDFQSRQDGMYVEFKPTGRCEPGYVRLSDEDGRSAEIACESPTELYRILAPGEQTSRRQ